MTTRPRSLSASMITPISSVWPRLLAPIARFSKSTKRATRSSSFAIQCHLLHERRFVDRLHCDASLGETEDRVTSQPTSPSLQYPMSLLVQRATEEVTEQALDLAARRHEFGRRARRLAARSHDRVG